MTPTPNPSLDNTYRVFHLLVMLRVLIEVREVVTEPHREETVTMFKWIYIVFASAASLCFLWLSYTGPPPPLVRDVYLPKIEDKPQFQLGNASYRPFNEAADRLWDALLPANKGAVLGTNITSGFHVWATPSMFHQLRCLRDIRAQFVKLARSWDDAQQFMSERGPGSDYENIAYCFDYVRQGFLCHADTTLHPVMQLSPEQKLVDGNALWHMCQDSSVLYQWADTSGVPRKDPLVREHPVHVNN